MVLLYKATETVKHCFLANKKRTNFLLVIPWNWKQFSDDSKDW